MPADSPSQAEQFNRPTPNKATPFQQQPASDITSTQNERQPASDVTSALKERQPLENLNPRQVPEVSLDSQWKKAPQNETKSLSLADKWATTADTEDKKTDISRPSGEKSRDAKVLKPVLLDSQWKTEAASKSSSSKTADTRKQAETTPEKPAEKVNRRVVFCLCTSECICYCHHCRCFLLLFLLSD